MNELIPLDEKKLFWEIDNFLMNVPAEKRIDCGGELGKLICKTFGVPRSISLEDIEKLLIKFDGHYYCEDSWYSCPLATEGCSDESQGKKCNCGLEGRIKRLSLAIKQLIEEGKC